MGTVVFSRWCKRLQLASLAGTVQRPWGLTSAPFKTCCVGEPSVVVLVETQRPGAMTNSRTFQRTDSSAKEPRRRRTTTEGTWNESQGATAGNSLVLHGPVTAVREWPSGRSSGTTTAELGRVDEG